MDRGPVGQNEGMWAPHPRSMRSCRAVGAHTTVIVAARGQAAWAIPANRCGHQMPNASGAQTAAAPSPPFLGP